MPYFLWVEDFKSSEMQREENIISSTIELVFGSILKNEEFDDEYDARDLLEEQGVTLKLNLLEALEFIRDPNELAKVDFVVLDVDMPLKRDGQPDKNNYLPPLIEQYQSETELKKIAGYQIYIDLVIELGFPKSHILFCSNHAGYFEEFTEKFKRSNIKFPDLLQKEHDEDIKNWLTEAHSDYFVLRRGIIEGCKNLRTLTEDKFHFNEFIKDDDKELSLYDVANYTEVLENFFPLSEPQNKQHIYKLFVRTLAHEWDATEPKNIKSNKKREKKTQEEKDKENILFAFSWIMKMTRNWMAHTKLFEQLEPKDVAFLFIINMRAMFDLGDDLLPYERKLLRLFKKTLSEDKMQDKMGNNPKKRNKTNLKGRDIPFVENYAELLSKTGNTWQAINFHDALNNLQKNKQNTVDNKFFIKGLYQTFWFLTSSGGVYIPKDKEQVKNFSTLNYQFNFFNYAKKPYLFEIARHIYTRSFP